MADAKAQKRAKFEHVFTAIRDELVEYVRSQGMPKDALEWFSRVSSCFVLVRRTAALKSV